MNKSLKILSHIFSPRLLRLMMSVHVDGPVKSALHMCLVMCLHKPTLAITLGSVISKSFISYKLGKTYQLWSRLVRSSWKTSLSSCIHEEDASSAVGCLTRNMILNSNGVNIIHKRAKTNPNSLFSG